MNPPADLPPGLIPVPMKGAVLLLTAPEFKAGIRRGKAWRRRVAMAKRAEEKMPFREGRRNEPPRT